MLYTREIEVPAVFRDTDTFSLNLLRRVEFTWEDTWTPKNNDVYSYELERFFRGYPDGQYIKVADLDINNRFVTDFIPDSELNVKSTSYTDGIKINTINYRIKCTCISSDNKANIGMVYFSKGLEIKLMGHNRQ